MHIAALSGHLPLVQQLVTRGADVNSVTPERCFTPLYMAAQENHLTVVKYLVDRGADVNLLTDVCPRSHSVLEIMNDRRL